MATASPVRLTSFDLVVNINGVNLTVNITCDARVWFLPCVSFQITSTVDSSLSLTIANNTIKELIQQMWWRDYIPIDGIWRNNTCVFRVGDMDHIMFVRFVDCVRNIFVPFTSAKA